MASLICCSSICAGGIVNAVAHHGDLAALGLQGRPNALPLECPDRETVNDNFNLRSASDRRIDPGVILRVSLD